jgi:hypothetical protein
MGGKEFISKNKRADSIICKVLTIYHISIAITVALHDRPLELYYSRDGSLLCVTCMLEGESLFP